jgi:hypothetical protein
MVNLKIKRRFASVTDHAAAYYYAVRQPTGRRTVRAFASRAIFSELPIEATYGTCGGRRRRGGDDLACSALEQGATTGAAPARASQTTRLSVGMAAWVMGLAIHASCIRHPAVRARRARRTVRSEQEGPCMHGPLTVNATPTTV